MKTFDAAVVGAGPAGTACAGELKRLGVDTVLLDKADFPRNKLCAGWITPEVIKDLNLDVEDYPGGMTEFNRIKFHVHGVCIPVMTRQYSIQRFEFDNWLLSRVKSLFCRHKVTNITEKNNRYIIDDKFCARYIIGAGGTHCPVYRALFSTSSPRNRKTLIITMEKEYHTEFTEKDCHLWFFDHRLPGYSWYVPKAGGYLNIGTGGKALPMNRKGQHIHDHFEALVKKLLKKGWISTPPSHVKGYAYHLRNSDVRPCMGNAYLTGDAAGLATRDMGEGIGPAVKSGILAARSIALGQPYTLKKIKQYSLPGILMSRFF